MDLNKQFDYVVMTNINILYAKNSFEFSLFIVIIFEIYILIGNIIILTGEDATTGFDSRQYSSRFESGSTLAHGKLCQSVGGLLPGMHTTKTLKISGKTANS